MGLLRQLSKKAIERVLPSQLFLTTGRAFGISLTFDDGPHPEHTPRVLDALAEADVRATFFVIGQQVRQYPSIVQRMVNEGHEVANHTWSHGEPSQTPSTQFLDEVRLTDSIIQDITGKDCVLMRPPKGELNLRKLWGLVAMRKTIVLWNQDTKDYRMASADDMSAWCHDYCPMGGDVLLLHDNRPYAAHAVQPLAEKARLAGVDFHPVTEQAGLKEKAPTDPDVAAEFARNTSLIRPL